MQTKKIIGIALCAAMLASIGAVAATSVSAADVTLDTSKLGVIGKFNSWSGDVAMTDEDGDGVYTAEITVPANDDQGFKVRYDGAWDYSWGVYEEDEDRTQNSQTNCLEVFDVDTTVTVSIDTNEPDFNFWPVSYSYEDSEGTITVFTGKQPLTKDGLPFDMNFGAIGKFNSWGGDKAMTDFNGDGIYEAKIVVPANDDQGFKVRANGSWDYSWGVYEEDEDRTQNSQTNCLEVFDTDTEVLIQLDTNGADYNLWPITYSFVDAEGNTVVKYVGKPEEEESSESESSEEASEVSKIEISESKIDDYIYFDNTNTKWDEVYCYYYAPEYGAVTDFAGRDIALPVDEAAGRVIWPGAKMEQVIDENGNPTDIWQYPAPIGATALFFNNGWSDPAVKEYFESLSADDQKKAKAEHAKSGFKCAYQTYEKGDGLAFNYDTDKGKVYAIKAEAVENDDYLTWNGGKFSLKASYSLEAMEEAKAYEGPFNKEVFDPNSTPETSTVSTVDQSSTTTESSTTGGNTTGGTTGGTSVPATSDTAMAVAFIGVAVAALGAAVLASKKKRDEE